MSERDYQKILQDLPRLRKVWSAIADLQFKPPDFEYVLRTCRESGYSWDELDHISRYEVAPATWFNWEYFFSGCWPLFEPFYNMDWLAERILKRVRRRRHAFTVKLLGRRMMSSTEESWREVERRFKAGQGGEPHPGE